MANKKYLDQEGLQLKIENKEGFEFQLFWNHDNPKSTLEHGEDDEFYVIVKGNIGRAGVDFSLEDAVVLRDTLDHMIKKISKQNRNFTEKGKCTMINHECTKKECRKQKRELDQDIRLMLTIRTSSYVTYHINKDGTLEYYDSDEDAQEHIIVCPVCETSYEFEHHLGFLTEQHVLPLETEEVTIKQKRV